MSERQIAVSWEIISDICKRGTKLIWPDTPNREAVCVQGVSGNATVRAVVVNPNRTITVTVNDPGYDGAPDALPAWRLQTNQSVLEYKGYIGAVVLDATADIFHGSVVGICDTVTFQGRGIDELRQAMADSVEDYLSFCGEHRKAPATDTSDGTVSDEGAAWAMEGQRE